MFGLATISKMNTLAEIAKQRFLARSLNNPKGHAKDAEKGRGSKIRKSSKKTPEIDRMYIEELKRRC